MTHTSPQPRVYRERPVTSRRRDNTNATHPWRVVGGTTADGRDRWTIVGRYDHVFATIVDCWNDPARASREAQASAIAAEILHPCGCIVDNISGPLETIAERLAGLQMRVHVRGRVWYLTALPADQQTDNRLLFAVDQESGRVKALDVGALAISENLWVALPIDQFIAKVGEHV